MDIEAKLMEKIKRFEDIKNQIADISKKIGGLTEQQRSLYNQGLELKGGIDALLSMKADEEKAKTTGLILPDKAIVGSDGKTVLAAAPAPDAPVTVDSAQTQVIDAPQAEVQPASEVSTPEAAPVVEAPAAPVEEPKAPITLEVK